MNRDWYEYCVYHYCAQLPLEIKQFIFELTFTRNYWSHKRTGFYIWGDYKSNRGLGCFDVFHHAVSHFGIQVSIVKHNIRNLMLGKYDYCDGDDYEYCWVWKDFDDDDEASEDDDLIDTVAVISVQ